jgi:hypothetical protein
MFDNPQPSGVPTTTSNVPNQVPDPSSSQPAPSLFAQQMAPVVAQQQSPPPVSQNPVTGGQQINGGNGQSPTPLYHDQSDKDTTDPRDFHPSVQNASIVRRVAETLAGGPRVQTTFDPQTGERKQTPVPLTSKQILLGAVANILGGAGQIAGNLSNRMQDRAPNPIQPLPTQQAAQKQAQQSTEDFNREQTQKLRKATIINANLEAMRTSFALRHEADQSLNQVVANHADDLANWNKAGAVEASNIPSSEVMQKGFDKAKYLAIPDGYLPVYNKDGSRVTDKDGIPVSELSYSVVDGTTQAPLSQDKYNQLAKYGLMSAKDGFKLPEGASISSAQLALMNHKLGLIQQTQRELDEVHEVVGGEKVDLAAQIKKNPQMLSAIEAFHNDAASTDPVSQIANMNASTNPKVKGAVGAITNLFGADNLKAYSARTQTAEDLTPDKAQSIVSDPRTDKNSTAYQKAAAFLKNSRTQKAQTAVDEAKAKQQAEAGSSDVQETARNIVSGDLARLSDLVSRKGEDRRAMMNAILAEAKSQGKNAADFSPTALETKSKMYEDYREGKTSQNISAFDAFLGHANDAMDANDTWRRSGSPLINKPLSWLAKNATNDSNYIAFDTSLEPVRKEFMSFLNANRAEHAEDLKTMQTVLNSDNSPAQIESALKQLGKSADIRLAAIGRKYQNTMGAPFPNLVSDDGKQTLSRMGITSKAVGQPPQTISVPAPNGRVYHFKDQAAADQFKKQAGIQ